MAESGKLDATADLPSTFTLFQQPWWLDAAAPGGWTAVEVQKNGVVTGRLPYCVQRRYGLTVMTMPPLTPMLGPWVLPSEGKNVLRIGEEIAVLDTLLEQIPSADLFRHGCAPEIANGLPFLWKDFDVTSAYTYRIDDLSDPDRIWSAMRDKTRHSIRKAGRELTVHTDITLEGFFKLQELTFARQGLTIPFSFDYLRRIDAACVARDRRRIFAAEDAQGQLHAAAYVVWDNRAAYYLLGAADPEFRRSGAQSLVLWEAIQFARTVARCFDFEGSILRPIEHYFRGFGGRLTPYVIVTRMSERMRAMYAVRRALRAALRGVIPSRSTAYSPD